MARKSKARYALLGILSIEPLSGYGIKQFIKVSISNFWKESYGSIYPTLKKLHEEGKISKRTEQDEGSPQRNVYSITPSGRRELEDWLKVAPEPRPRRHELLLKLFFGSEVGEEAMITHLENYRAERQERSQMLKGIEKYINTSPDMPEKAIYWLLTVRFGIRRMQSEIEWAGEAIETLKAAQKQQKQ